MFCPNCGNLGIFDDFVETDFGEVPAYECPLCEVWFYGCPTKHAPYVVESVASSELVQASAESTSQSESNPATTQVM